MSRMDNENCGESVCSVDKESTHVEHDYCRAEVTCHTGEKEDHGLVGKFTEQAVEKWTDGPPVQVRNDDDDDNKCRIPAVMGQVLRRVSTIFGVPTPNNLSEDRKEASAETPHPAKAAEPEESSAVKSRRLSISEYETPSANVRNPVRNAADDSGMISQESDLSESTTPDFEFLRDVPTQPQPAQRLTPVCPSPACPKAFASSATPDASIHSQPTQILTGGGELPDFRQAFGSILPSNFSNSSSPPPSLTPHYPSSDTGEGVVDLGTQCDNSNDASPPSLTPNYLSSDSGGTVRADTPHTSDADVDLDAQHENSPSLFSIQNYPTSDNQETALTDTSDTRRAVVDLEAHYENSNCRSPRLFSTHERTARADISEINGGVIDLERQYDFPPLVSTQNYPPSDNQETPLTDTSDTRRVLVDLGTQYDNSYSGDSPPLFSTQNYLLSANQETALTDTSDTRRAVVDLETRYENSNSVSPSSFFDASDTHQEVIDVYTRYENSNSGDSMLAQSITSNLELSDIQRVIDREIRYENSNGSKVTRPAPMDLESTDTRRVIDREIRYEKSNCFDSTDTQRVIERQIGYENSDGSKVPRSAAGDLESTDTQRVIDRLELTESTASITEFLDTRCGLDNVDLPTQTRSPFRQDSNENLVAKNKQTPKRKREEEPESLWTDEDYSQSGSPVLEIMSNHLGRLSKVAAPPCAISIGENLSAPEFLTAPFQNPENVSLDHSYSERTRKSFAFRTLELEGSKREEAVEIRTVGEFTGSDTSNLRNFGRRRVRKVEKRKIDFHASKENRRAKKRRVRDETTRRSNFDSKESPANLEVPRECDRTGSIEFSEGLLSNDCCEYDHIFLNVSSIDDLLYDPILLRHLVEPNYEAIKRKIDVLVTRIEALGEEL